MRLITSFYFSREYLRISSTVIEYQFRNRAIFERIPIRATITKLRLRSCDFKKIFLKRSSSRLSFILFYIVLRFTDLAIVIYNRKGSVTENILNGISASLEFRPDFSQIRERYDTGPIETGGEKGIKLEKGGKIKR